MNDSISQKKNALIIFFSKMKSISLNLAKPIFQIFNRLEEDASKDKRLNTARKFKSFDFLRKNEVGYISILRILVNPNAAWLFQGVVDESIG